MGVGEAAGERPLKWGKIRDRYAGDEELKTEFKTGGEIAGYSGCEPRVRQINIDGLGDLGFEKVPERSGDGMIVVHDGVVYSWVEELR